MVDQDVIEFTKMLDSTCSMLSRGTYKPDARSALLFFRAVQRFEFAEVEAAFAAHINDPARGKFVPVPADIIAQIHGMVACDGRPDPEEAWALSLRAADQGATVVWTSEMAEAFGICRTVLEAGDEVGARMAFKSAYSRLIEEARQIRKPTKWAASLGHNKDEQYQTMLPHVQRGRLPRSELPIAGPCIGLLELAASPHAPESVKQSLMAIRARIVSRKDAPSQDYLDKQRTAELKAQADRAATAYAERMT